MEICWKETDSLEDFVKESALRIKKNEGSLRVALLREESNTPLFKVFTISKNFKKAKSIILEVTATLPKILENSAENIAEKIISGFGGADFILTGCAGRLQIAGHPSPKEALFANGNQSGIPANYTIKAHYSSGQEAETFSGLIGILGISSSTCEGALHISEEPFFTEHTLTPRKLARAYQFARKYLPEVSIVFQYSSLYNNRLALEFEPDGKVKLRKYCLSYFKRITTNDFTAMEDMFNMFGTEYKNQIWDVN